ncbi:MAG: hypothetical protein JNM30_06365 [Rhodospirillales bacterium]|nr:hypothetical protein [Rhodospirillales bacterium]
MTRLRPALAALALLAGFAGVGPALADPEDCPDFGLVPELTRLTQFKNGPGRTLDDVRYDIVVRNFGQAICGMKDRKVRVSVRLEFAVERGRAEQGSRIEFAYFVAIRHRVTGDIVTKEVFPVAFNLPQGRDNVVIEEELEQVTIPIKKDEEGRYYAILVGLQLTEEQLEFNRRRRGEQVQPRAPGQAPGGAPGAPGGQPQRALPTLPGLPPAKTP